MVQQALVFYDNNTSNDLYAQVFANELFGSVRSILINNEPWFIGSDVARCLGYSRPNDAIRDHVYDEYKNIINLNNTPVNQRGIIDSYYEDNTTANHRSIPGNPNVVIINEAGLYQLIFSSKLPSAKVFSNWVYSEVLPTMRQIGFTNSMSILRQELDILHNRLDNTECDKQYYKRQYNVLNSKYKKTCKDYNVLEDKYNELDNNYDTLVDQFQYVIDNNDIKYY